MKKLILLLVGLSIVITAWAVSGEKSYINDKDGYTNVRKEPNSNSPVIAKILEAEIFISYPQSDSSWYRVETNNSVSGYVHKSRIKTFSDLEVEISNFFNNFINAVGVEASEVGNEDLFSYIQKFPEVFVQVFARSDYKTKNFIIKELESPIHDLIDLKLIHARIQKTNEIPEKYRILKALELAASKIGMNLTHVNFQSQCKGMATTILSINKSTIYMCHGSYEDINPTKLYEWQGCIDGIFYLRKSDNGQMKETKLFDCLPYAKQEYRVAGNILEFKHYFSEYPEFEDKERIIEAYDIETGKYSYKILGDVKKYTREEIDKAVAEIADTLSKPFDGSTYFRSIYSSLFMIRDYTFIDPNYSLSILNGYARAGWADGEVAEVLHQLIDEAELIAKAVKNQ